MLLVQAGKGNLSEYEIERGSFYLCLLLFARGEGKWAQPRQTSTGYLLTIQKYCSDQSRTDSLLNPHNCNCNAIKVLKACFLDADTFKTQPCSNPTSSCFRSGCQQVSLILFLSLLYFSKKSALANFIVLAIQFLLLPSWQQTFQKAAAGIDLK